MIATRQYKIAFFDCDGVLLDSNQFKTEAFRQSLNDEAPADVEHLITYHKTHGGISRYAKFLYYYRDYKSHPDYEARVRAALDRFSGFSRRGLMEAPTVPGVEHVLDCFARLGVPCFVVSGSDQEELREVLKLRGLSGHFAAIFGSPVTKQSHLSALVQSGQMESPGIYFGDARSDFEAAHAYGLEFVFVAHNSDWKEGRSVCTAARCTILRDFTELALC